MSQTPATIVTHATPTAQLGQFITDTAIVIGPPTLPSPTGTVTFTLFGPDDATCAAPPIFIGVEPLAPAGPDTAFAFSHPFTPSAAGTYRWVAVYSGDANYQPASGACNDANETSVVVRASATIVTEATRTADLGQPITDTATVSGLSMGPTPTGTVIFTVFGPNDPTCAGPPIFTTHQPLTPTGLGTAVANSGPFAPSAAGTYRWAAVYSGDPNYQPASGACNDANETSVVHPSQPTLTTTASPGGTVGTPLTDTAMLSGGFNPTGTITFNLYGPNDATCAGPPVFTSTVPVNGNGSYTSASFVPTAPGTYRWVASYSGDANNIPVTNACGDPAETVTVTPPPAGSRANATGALINGRRIAPADCPPGGGSGSPGASTGLITIGALNAACTNTAATASAANVNVGTLRLGLVKSQCTTGPNGTASSSVVRLGNTLPFLGAVPISTVISGPTILNTGLFVVTLNEVITTPTTRTVNAVRIRGLGQDVIVAQSQCSTAP